MTAPLLSVIYFIDGAICVILGGRDLWWALPPWIDFTYFILQSALATRYTFDFPFCPNGSPPLVQKLSPIRLDEHSQFSVVHLNRS